MRPLLLAFLALCALIIARSPVVYWWDAHVRLASAGHVLLGRWLPLLQLVIAALGRIDAPLVVTRAVMALLAAAAVVAIYTCASVWAGRATGLTAALLLAANSMTLTLATVPYQEPLFLAGVFAGLACWARPGGRWRAAAVAFVALACLTRYEGWLLPPILLADEAWRATRGGHWRAAWPGLALTAAGLLAAPLLWLALGGMALYGEEGGLVSTADLPGVLAEYVLGFARMATLPVVALGGLGLVVAWRERPAGYTRWGTALLLLLVLLGNLAAGLYSPGNLRRPYLGVALLLPFAALGFVWLVGRLGGRPTTDDGPQTEKKGSVVTRLVNRPPSSVVRRLSSLLPLLALAAFTAWQGLAGATAAAGQADFRAGYDVGRALAAGALDCPAVVVLDADPGFRYVVAVYAGRPPAALIPLADPAALPAAPRPLCVVDRHNTLDGHRLGATSHAAGIWRVTSDE